MNPLENAYSAIAGFGGYSFFTLQGGFSLQTLEGGVRIGMFTDPLAPLIAGFEIDRITRRAIIATPATVHLGASTAVDPVVTLSKFLVWFNTKLLPVLQTSQVLGIPTMPLAAVAQPTSEAGSTFVFTKDVSGGV